MEQYGKYKRGVNLFLRSTKSEAFLWLNSEKTLKYSSLLRLKIKPEDRMYVKDYRQTTQLMGCLL